MMLLVLVVVVVGEVIPGLPMADERGLAGPVQRPQGRRLNLQVVVMVALGVEGTLVEVWVVVVRVPALIGPSASHPRRRGWRGCKSVEQDTRLAKFRIKQRTSAKF